MMERGSLQWEMWRAKLKKPKPPRSPEHCLRISAANKGKKHSLQFKELLSRLAKKRGRTLQHEEALRKALSLRRGIPRNTEHIAKMVATRKLRGNYVNASHVREAVGLASRNRKRTFEEKEKIAAALRGRKRDPAIARKASATRKARRTIPYPEKRQKDPKYKPWRQAVLARDGFACKKCGQVDAGHHAHHLLPWSDFPELRYEVGNAITLCNSCHTKTHWEERRKQNGLQRVS